MAELTLGQILDMAIRTPNIEPIDFEQLRNLLNGMLVHLGLRDLPVQDSGEPPEGTPRISLAASVAADIEELRQKTEANEREIAEVRALCEELREEIKEMKEEHSQMAENMQKLQESLDPANLQDMLDNLRNELLDTVVSAVKDMMGQEGQVSPDWQQGSGTHPHPWVDRGLIVIGNEIALSERSRTSLPRQRVSSPVTSRSKARAQSRGKDSLPRVTSSPRVSFTARDVGSNNVGRNHMGPIKDKEIQMGISKGAAALPSPRAWGRGKNLLHGPVSSPRVSSMESDVGWNDMEQVKNKEIKTGISKGAALPSSKAWSREKNLVHGVMSSPQDSFMESDVRWSDTEQVKNKEIITAISKGAALPSSKAWSREENLVRGVTRSPQDSFMESDLGWNDVEQIEDEEIKTNISKAKVLPSPLDAPPEMDMEQIKDEEIKISISKAESLPSPLYSPPEMNDMEEIKDKEMEMSISKAPPQIQTKSLDSSDTALGVHPGSPSTHIPIQQVQSGRGHPASQTLWIPAESVAGTNRFLTAKEAQGGGSLRLEPSQTEPGMKLLKVSSSEYLPSDQPFTTQFPGLRSPLSPGSLALPRLSDTALYTPPPSPGPTGHLPHLAKHQLEHKPRRQAAKGYSRRSPMYCGGRHTSSCPVQPMEPLLPDPSKPGVFDLVGRDGLIYRGRQSSAPVGSWMEGASFSNLQ